MLGNQVMVAQTFYLSDTTHAQNVKTTINDSSPQSPTAHVTAATAATGDIQRLFINISS